MKGIISPAYQHAIAVQKHTNWALQAMLLAEKRMTFGSQQLAKIRNVMCMNEIQKSLMLGVFATKIKVVRKYAKERRVCCQENSLCLIGSHSISSTKQIGQIIAHTVC